MATHQLSLEEISQLGEKFYLEQKDILEKDYMGQFVVIDVERGQYQVDVDRLAAIEKAKRAFGEKLFYILQVGNFQHPGLNYSSGRYAWNF